MARLVTRRQAAGMLRHHLAPIAALALAADDAVASLGPVLYPAERPMRYVAKTAGLQVTTLWTESVREWITLGEPATRPHNITVYDPYNWVELMVSEALHARLVRDDTRQPDSDRQRDRANQVLEFGEQLSLLDHQPTRVTAVDIAAHLNRYGRIASMSVRAPGGSEHLWAPLRIDLLAARRQLVSWRGRGVPWLATADRARALATHDRMLVTLDQQREEIAQLQAEVAHLRATPISGRTRAEVPAKTPRRAGYRMRPNPNADAGPDAAEGTGQR